MGKFIVLSIFLFFLSCAKTVDYVETCKDIKCSENAYCEVIDDIPTCFCNDGYLGDGLICNEIKNYSWQKTIGGKISDFSKVVKHDDENNIYMAGSFEGEVNFGSSGVDIRVSGYRCEARTPCEETCESNEICNFDTKECECKKGFHREMVTDNEGESLEVCKKDTCEDTCDSDEICIDGKCECKDGYHRDGNLGNCEENFVCQMTCSKNEECDNGVCVCKYGYYKAYKLNSYIAKFAEDGSLIWVKTFYSTDYNEVMDIALYGDYIYILGKYKGQFDLDPSDGVDFRKGRNEENTYLVKMTKDGEYIDGITFKTQQPFKIAVDNDENLYVSGCFKGEVEFRNFYFLNTLESVSESYDAFLVKFKSDLEYLWSFKFGSTDWDGITSFAIDKNNDIYAVGVFNGTVDFNPGEGEDLHIGNGLNDMFIAKFNSSGKYLWTKTFGGVNYDSLDDIKIDKDGNLVVAGSFSDTFILDEDKRYESNGMADLFVGKLDKDGNFLWVKTFGGPNWDINSMVAIDEENNIYTSGAFTEYIVFPDGVKKENLDDSVYSYDSYIAKIDKDGNFLWSRIIGGISEEYINELDVDNLNNLLITGEFWSDMILETTTENFKAEGDGDIFLFKIK